MRTMLRGKIHRARVTDGNIAYEGSITIDLLLMKKAEILTYEKVAIYNISNGERFSTYAIPGDPESGVICLNGAAARKAARGDLIIIATYELVEEEELGGWIPCCVFVDENNRIK